MGQKTAQHSATRSVEPPAIASKAKTLRNSGGFAENVGDTGFDSPSNSSGNPANPSRDGAHSGARNRVDDTWLARLIDVWPGLSDDVRGEILRLAGLRADDVDDLNGVGAAVALGTILESHE
jgi:hypothetical protein